MALFGNNNVGFMGGAPPTYVTNWAYRPQGQLYDQSATVTTTINRLYYVPFRVWEQHTFTAVKTYNSGAGDNTETWRQGIYSHTSAGPTTLLGDFGQGTLTAAAAPRTLSASVALAPGIYWHAFHASTAAAWFAHFATQTTVGQYSYDMLSFTGTPDWGGSTTNQSNYSALYVDTPYATLANTAVAPTSTIGLTPAILLVA